MHKREDSFKFQSHSPIKNQIKFNANDFEKERSFSQTPIRLFDQYNNDKLTTTNQSEQGNHVIQFRNQLSKEKQIFKER